MSRDVAALAADVDARARAWRRLELRFGDCRIRVESNESKLLDGLRAYYAAFHDADAPPAGPDFTVRAHQLEPPDFGVAYEPWKREPGKDEGKEAFCDLPDGRAVLKVRTGMQFLVSAELRVACGDCLANPNQVVNFINYQFTSWHMNRGRALCHAAGVVRGGRGLALASFSGGGKSTLALHLVGEGFDFASNDRVLAGRRRDGRAEMWGVPKHPRINPGTILNDPNLDGLLATERARELRALPREALWALEEKHDAIIDRVYGPGRVVLRAPLDALLVLAWSPASREPARFEEVDLRRSPDVLAAIMKSPGPFFLPDDGPAPRGHEPPDEAGYLEALAGLPVVVARGGVDFEAGAARARSLLAGDRRQSMAEAP